MGIALQKILKVSRKIPKPLGNILDILFLTVFSAKLDRTFLFNEIDSEERTRRVKSLQRVDQPKDVRN